MELQNRRSTITLWISLAALSGCAATPSEEPNEQASGGTATNSPGSGNGSGSGNGLSGSATVPGGNGSGDNANGSSGSASAGSASGGSMNSGCAAVDPMLLLSDFETGKAEVIATAGRDGSWFLYGDGTGTQTPVKIVNTPLAAEAGGACASGFAFHTTGTGFMTWGAGFGTDFAPKSAAAARTTYDLSQYSGIAFRAKAASATPVRVSISDANTAPEGMLCVDTSDNTNAARCGDYFGAEVSVTTEYQDLKLTFASMAQRGWGLPVATGFDPKTAYTLRIQVKGSAAAPANFDLWFDDIRFVP